jgi:hypothetical protein
MVMMISTPCWWEGLLSKHTWNLLFLVWFPCDILVQFVVSVCGSSGHSCLTAGLRLEQLLRKLDGEARLDPASLPVQPGAAAGDSTHAGEGAVQVIVCLMSCASTAC